MSVEEGGVGARFREGQADAERGGQGGDFVHNRGDSALTTGLRRRQRGQATG